MNEKNKTKAIEIAKEMITDRLGIGFINPDAVTISKTGKEKKMNRKEIIWTDAWFDGSRDLILVKVCIRGDTYKKGVIIRLTEEQLLYLEEGQEYPTLNLNHDPFLVKHLDEIIVVRLDKPKQPFPPEAPVEPEIELIKKGKTMTWSGVYEFECEECKHITSEVMEYDKAKKGIICPKCGKHAVKIVSVNARMTANWSLWNRLG